VGVETIVEDIEMLERLLTWVTVGREVGDPVVQGVMAVLADRYAELELAPPA
jgi:hypothetical protein